MHTASVLGLNVTACLINSRLPANILGCLFMLTFHVADKVRRRIMFSRMTRAPAIVCFSRMAFEDSCSTFFINPQRHDASLDIVKGWDYSRIRIHYRQYRQFPRNPIERWSFLCDRFVESICREKCTYRIYWVMISIKFGAVLTEDGFSCDDTRSTTASDSIEREGTKTRRHGGGKSFHRYHVGAAFLLRYFPSWVADLDDAEDGSLSKSNYTPSYTRFMALVGSAYVKYELWLLWCEATFWAGCGRWTRICLLGPGIESKHKWHLDTDWNHKPIQPLVSLVSLPASFILGKTNISLLVDVCFWGQRRTTEKGKL